MSTLKIKAKISLRLKGTTDLRKNEIKSFYNNKHFPKKPRLSWVIKSYFSFIVGLILWFPDLRNFGFFIQILENSKFINP